MKEAIKIAFATDDGKKFIDRHFGDALYYDIYELNGRKADYLKRITNTTDEEEGHADPKKAKGISELLKNEGVQVVISRIFGPNIKRIKKKFVCIIVKNDTITEAIRNICENTEKIFEEWEKGGDRKHLNLD